MERRAGQNEGHSLSFVLFLFATAFVCGGMVMVIEVMGSRVISPFFGVSLFVWTSLIAVTLTSLAVGYAAGGIASDRMENPDVLYGVILAAGLFVLAVPFIRGPVLAASASLGLRTGSLVSSLVLFGPALMLLGGVSPYVVKLAAREIRRIGRTVGLFYSVSTVGSVAGTLSTGFFLITYFGVSAIFIVVGAALVALSVVYFALFRGKWAFLLLLLSPLAPLTVGTPREVVRPDGLKVSVVFSKDSFYGNLKVVDYTFGTRHHRELAIDGFLQGGIDMNTGESTYGYSYLLQYLPAALRPGGESCLVIGLGAGLVPRWYESRGVSVDVVDIDPEIVEIARAYFGFRLAGEVFVADARYHLLSSEKTYDYLIMDVFNGDVTPGHLLSLEALRLVKQRMRPGGVFAANIVGRLRGDTFMTASVYRTLREVFDTVEWFPLFDPGGEEGYGNLVITAYDGPPRTLDPGVMENFTYHPIVSEALQDFRKRTFAFPEGVRSMVLTDDYNPIDFFDRSLKEAVRSDILRTASAAVLL